VVSLKYFRAYSDYTRRGLDCQLDLLGLDTDTLNDRVYTSRPRFKYLSLGDVRQDTNSSYPIGEFKHSGTSVPKYSSLIC
jgi:hypothetical protein